MDNMNKPYNFKDHMINKKDRFVPGHRMCAGCGGAVTVRSVLRSLHDEDKAVIGNATSCLEVSSYMYPYSAYEDSYIHNAFENAGATMSGVETAYNVLKKKGKIDETDEIMKITRQTLKTSRDSTLAQLLDNIDRQLSVIKSKIKAAK